MAQRTDSVITVAIGRGRLLRELRPVLEALAIEPDPQLFDESHRQLVYPSACQKFRFLRTRSFDVPTFVENGAATLGFTGTDVIAEQADSEILMPVLLPLGFCQLVLAGDDPDPKDLLSVSHVHVATKYPRLTRAFFQRSGVRAECIKLNGAIELAPRVGLSRYIVDLVSTGETLRANGLHPLAVLQDVQAGVIVNQAGLKRNPEPLWSVIDALQSWSTHNQTHHGAAKSRTPQDALSSSRVRLTKPTK